MTTIIRYRKEPDAAVIRLETARDWPEVVDHIRKSMFPDADPTRPDPGFDRARRIMLKSTPPDTPKRARTHRMTE